MNNKNKKEVFKYAEDIVNGKITANKYRKLACQRFLNDVSSGKWKVDFKAAEFCIEIIEKTFCHMQGENQKGEPLRGKPFKLMTFHKFIIYNLLGFYNKKSNIRRFSECLIFIPRKNVKTSFAGAFAYALGLLERMSGAKVYVVAAALKQTMETFDFVKYNIKNMGEQDTDGGHFHIIDNNNEHSIKADNIGGGSFNLYALAANPDVQDSFNCNIAICDEIHAFKKAKQYSLFKDAMKAYRNKLMIGISTAGDNPSGFLAQRIKYCKKVLDGEIKDDKYFIFIAEADPSIGEDGKEFYDFTNPVVHEMANPAYGESISPEELRADSLQAANDPQSRKDFFAKSLNVFTSSIRTYFDMALVKASDEKYSWTLEELAKLPIYWYGGADLSKMHDLTGTAIHGRYNDVDISITHGFIPIVTAHQKADEDNIPFFWWEENGWLTLCNSATIDYSEPAKWFLSLKEKGFKIKWIGYDRRYSREFIIKMKSIGFKLRDQAQRYVEKTEAFREIEKKIIGGQYYYCHNKAFEYCIENVHAIEDSDDFVRFEKINPTQRIDLFDADVIATKQMLIDIEKSERLKNWF